MLSKPSAEQPGQCPSGKLDVVDVHIELVRVLEDGLEQGAVTSTQPLALNASLLSGWKSASRSTAIPPVARKWMWADPSPGAGSTGCEIPSTSIS